MAFRIFIDLVILVAIIEGWWLVALPICIIAAWKYDLFFEAIAAGLAYDSLFGFLPAQGLVSYFGIIISISILLVMAGAKKVVRK